MSDFALKLIRKAKKENATYLDLGRCGLTKLPDELFDLTNLKTLILSNEWLDYKAKKFMYSINRGPSNNINSLSKLFYKLVNIERLIIAGSWREKWEIQDIKPLEKLTALTTLYCPNTKVSDLKPLEKLTALTTLYCPNTKVSDLKPLEKLTALTELDFSSTQVSDLKPLEKLTALTTLDCFSTQVSDLKPLEKLTALTTLDCSSTQVSDLKPLEKLTALKELYFSSTQVSDLKPLEKLTALIELNCFDTQLSDLKPLEKLTALTTLNCYITQVSDLKPLEKLTALTRLNCSSTQVSDLKPLEKLTALTELYFSSTQVSDLKPLEKLTALTTLDCSSTQVSDLKPLEKLTALTTLDCSSTQVSDLKPLEKLTALKELYFSSTQVSDLKPLEKLTALTTLYCPITKVSDLKPLEKLTALTTLDCPITKVSDLKPLEKLTVLTTLDCSSTQVSDLKPLKKLTALKELYFSSTQVSDLKPLEKLTALTTLDCSSTQVSDLKPLKKLTALTTLDCSSTQVSDLKPLKKLTALTKLNCSKTRVSDLKQILSIIEKGIPVHLEGFTGVIVGGNSLSSPPIEIVQQGNEAIIRYFKQIEEQKGTEPLYEAKLIIVGEPGAGKTSLMRKLLNESYEVKEGKDDESTIGINIHEGWAFQKTDGKDMIFRANLWDFGGQVIQYMTHQFFLTPSALYVLVADDRKQNTNFPYWFEIINLLGREESYQSPILVVLNENKHRSVTNYDHTQFKQRYPNTRINLAEVDLSKTDDRFFLLRKQIQEMLCDLQHVGNPLPKMWQPIREKLRELSKEKDYIQESEYSLICTEYGVEEKGDQFLLSGYLHKLGSILHYQNDNNLRDFIILNPHWAVKAVYSILDDDDVKKAGGVFTQEKMDKVWCEYTHNERGRLLNLMKKESFEICYEIATGKYIAPQLLENIRPKYEWNSVETLKFQFKYPFLPKGIVTRLIVRLNEHIAYSGKLVWQKGVVLEKDGCRVQVIEDDFPKQVIELEASGQSFEKKYALRWVRNEIEAIHRKWFRNIPYETKVPCICNECKLSDNPYFFDYTRLVKFLEKNKKEDTCGNSVTDVSILELLEGIFVEEEMKKFQSDMRDEMELIKHGLSRMELQHEMQIGMIDEIKESTSQMHQQLTQLLVRLDESQASNEILNKLLSRIEDAMSGLAKEFSVNHDVVAKWTAESQKVKAITDVKGKLKFVLPLIPFVLKYETELSFDWKKVFKELWKDLTTGRALI